VASLELLGDHFVHGDNTFTGSFIKTSGDVPSTATESCTVGEIRWSTVSNKSYIYLCILPTQWMRTELTSWESHPVTPITIFKPENNAALVTAVNSWVSDNATALSNYGEINTWDTSPITDMRDLFKNNTTFNDNISNWDTSNVKNMVEMFSGATAFNQYIGSWNTSSVTTM
jgi:surface protein